MRWHADSLVCVEVFRYLYGNGGTRCMSDAADQLLPGLVKVGAQSDDELQPPRNKTASKQFRAVAALRK